MALRLLFHLAVVLEETDVIDGGLNPEHTGEFVVDLDTCKTHVMLDATSLDARRQSRADFLCQLRRDLFAQKARNPLCVRRQYRLPRNGVINRHQNLLAAKHQIGRVFDLSQTPGINLP